MYYSLFAAIVPWSDVLKEVYVRNTYTTQYQRSDINVNICSRHTDTASAVGGWGTNYSKILRFHVISVRWQYTLGGSVPWHLISSWRHHQSVRNWRHGFCRRQSTRSVCDSLNRIKSDIIEMSVATAFGLGAIERKK